MYDYAVLHLYCPLALSTVNSHMPCASTEGQKVMKNAGKYKYLCSTKKSLGKKNYSTFPPQTSIHTPRLAKIIHN
jgi:hypothetical protein